MGLSQDFVTEHDPGCPLMSGSRLQLCEPGTAPQHLSRWLLQSGGWGSQQAFRLLEASRIIS